MLPGLLLKLIPPRSRSMTAATYQSPLAISFSGVGKARAVLLIVSGSPGFQLVTSFAKTGSGRDQLIEDGSSPGLLLVSITKTRPLNGVSSADESNVRRNSSGAACA